MKKIISVILLFVFSYNIGGYYIWFKLEQLKIKSEIRSDLEVKDLTLIKVPLNDKSSIVWIEKNKEFIYHGDMYDVVKMKTINKTKYYYCINDKKEKQLIADFAKNNKSQKKSKNRSQKITNNKFQIQHFALFVFNQSADIRYYALSNHYCSNINDVLSPPPKAAIS